MNQSTSITREHSICAPTLGERHLSAYEREALAFLMPLSPDYPGVEGWFLNKVVPGLRFETRKIVRIERHGQLVALGIGKKEKNETKICTVRVSPEYSGRGFGLQVFDELLNWMENDYPHLTVSESRRPSFERIFAHFGFQLTSVRNGLYLPRKIEFLYNEPSILSEWHQRTCSTGKKTFVE